VIQANDVVQIDPAHDPVFGACLLIVTEIKAWGVIGYVKIPGKGLAYYRVPFEKIHKVGAAEWVQQDT